MDKTYEQYMDLACSVSGSCPADFAKGENPDLSLDSEPSGLEAAARSRSHDLGMSEPSNKRLSAAERKLQSNRQAQKRFRQRQKERSHTAEAKLLETTAQLEELQVRQRQLEARNLLLEKVARLNKQTVLREAHEPVPLPWEGDAMWQAKLSEGGKTLVLTVWSDKTQLLTVEQASQLTLPEFGRLWKEYVQKLGACLLDAREDDDGPSTANMNKWAAEATSLMVCMALRNPWAVRAFNAAVDASSSPGKICAGQWKSSHLLAVVSYTPEQVKDLMHLRLLFYSRIGQLCRERKALLRHMADEQDVGANIGLDDVSVRLSEVSDLAEQLRANGADEYRTYMQFSSAFSRGLHTSRQLAVIIVHTHPWVPCKHHLLEELARQQQQAPVAQILESAETDSIEHSADWEEIVTYLQTITPENLHEYIPLGRSQSPGPLASSPDLDDADLGLAEEILSVLS
ncbi:hypothetical protein WJX79_000172 [Trebouxia sp. C0005]|nr:MAG: hypothetical protein FRX49_02012 [Trebouxia sp. A1-2]